MSLHTKECLVVVGTFLASILVLNECRKLAGYKYPVYSTALCPRNETEWIERSSALNCNKSNGYTCLPNENFDELLEFCYIVPVERIQKGFCLYLVKRVSLTNSYSCSHFAQGCHNHSFLSNEIYKYPACISLGNGCFLAEPSCKSITPPHIQSTTQQFENVFINEWNKSTTTHPQQSSELPELDNTPINDNDDALFVPILLGIYITLCILSLLSGYYIRISQRKDNSEIHDEIESGPLLGDETHSNNGADCSHEEEECTPSIGKDNDNTNQASSICRRKDNLEIHEEGESGPLLSDEKHSNNDTGCSHEEEECTPSVGKDKDKTNQVCRRKDDVDIHDEIKSGPLLGDEKHSNNGTGCSHEDEECTPSFGKNKDKTNQASSICRRKNDAEIHDDIERGPLLGNEKLSNNDTGCNHEEEECTLSIEKDKDKTNQESQMEKAIFNQWEQDDSCFMSTKAYKEVEKNIKLRNLVIVAGHSGSGKSAIIQHIALEYRKQGWTVKRVKEVKDIVEEYASSRFQRNNTICVFNDPLGKESFDEILNNSWQKYREELELYLKTAKLVMSCRSHIICDARLTRYLVNRSNVVNIDDNKSKLSVQEKRQILTKYTSHMNLSDEDCSKIFEVERYFPLLCKLYSSKEEYKSKGIGFFTEPVTVLKEEIEGFRKEDQGKYCALALLVLFNGDLCVRNLLKNKDTEYKFKHTLKLCGLPENTPPSAIRDNLNSLKDFFVKKVGDKYHFYHDLVMEVTTYVFGTDYPAETIKYADIGFLRRRVELGNCEEHSDSFTVYLNDKYKEELGERLFTELIGERMLDVVLNHCLRNETVIEIMKKKIADHPEYLQLLLETKKLTVNKQELDRTSKNLLLTKLSFLNIENEVTPLFALIVFCHTQLSQYCVNTLQQKQICFLISAMCCNGSVELFFDVFKDHGEESLEKTWGSFYPIHIVSVFHNYKLLGELIKMGVKVNQKTDDYGSWTPLMLAAGNDTQENGDYNHRESGADQRDKTVQLLLSNGADINLCHKNGASPLYIACQNGHDTTVQLLLSNEADVNLCDENGFSPLYIACQDGHDSIVQLLVSNRADINLCYENGFSPLYKACQKGHDSTVQLLLSNGADINLCNKNGASPLYIACENGNDSTVHLLVSNGADINLCDEEGTSPLSIVCFNGHDSTVQLLVSNEAAINLCNMNGFSPLYIACQNGHDSTVQLLLSNGADINLCEEEGTSPLTIACQNGHDSTVQLLVSNGADINLCDEEGTSPLSIVCFNGHDSTVQLLVSNEADINLCNMNGFSPLYIACQNGHDSTVQLLLSNGADINLCNKNGASPLYIACQNGHDSTVQLLLSNGADINLCMKDRVSPLMYAFENRHYKSVNILLNNGADTSLACGWEVNPALVHCFDKQDCTVVFLLQKDNISNNMYDPDSFFSLFVSCQVERVTRMIFKQ